MIVHDVIAMVARDALTSVPKGSYACNHFNTLAEARECASRYNECTTVSGVDYTVDSVDEESPERFPTLEMIRHGEAEPRPMTY